MSEAYFFEEEKIKSTIVVKHHKNKVVALQNLFLDACSTLQKCLSSGKSLTGHCNNG
jgi:hypothetical protein